MTRDGQDERVPQSESTRPRCPPSAHEHRWSASVAGLQSNTQRDEHSSGELDALSDLLCECCLNAHLSVL